MKSQLSWAIPTKPDKPKFEAGDRIAKKTFFGGWENKICNGFFRDMDGHEYLFVGTHDWCGDNVYIIRYCKLVPVKGWVKTC